jgi:hypothetical protein
MPFHKEQIHGKSQSAARLTTTMGSASDLVSEGTRRMLVNAVYWCVGLEDTIPETGAKADIVGVFTPTFYGFGSFKKGMKPADYAQ